MLKSKISMFAGGKFGVIPGIAMYKKHLRGCEQKITSCSRLCGLTSKRLAGVANEPKHRAYAAFDRERENAWIGDDRA